MENQLLHIFQNTPFGREALLQSVYFCSRTGIHLKIYVPEHIQFLMYFSREVVTIDLDKSFLTSPESAKEHAEELMQREGVTASFLEPKRYTSATLPDIPINFGFMCCPRDVSDFSSKISLAHVSPGVHAIVRNATFPLLVPTPVYKEWHSIMVFFGGSANAVNAFRLGLKLQLLTGLPLQLFTYAEKKPRSHYEEILDAHDLSSETRSGRVGWVFADKARFRESLYAVPHDALVITGVYGHGLIKELIFGSMMEEMQAILPNNMVVVGPQYSEY